MDTIHLNPVREMLRMSKIGKLPDPWRKIGCVAVGGLQSVGFDRESELLLVTSSSGRGVIDCRSGERVARDDSTYVENEIFLEAQGIGALQGQTIRMSGMYGGGLPNRTCDGWSVEVVVLDWPAHQILLLEPFSSLYDCLYGKSSRFHKIAEDFEIRACGFSFSGLSFIIATSSDVTIFSRDVDL